MKTKILVNTPARTLTIEGKTIKLEDSLLGAETSPSRDSRSLDLRYKPTEAEEDSPVYRDLDKLEEAYGAEFLESIGAGGSFPEEAHYLTFSGDIDPRIEGRKCYDILQPLECRERRSNR